MRIDEALAMRRETVLDRWFAAVLETYPEDTARLMRGVADPFANPVGSTVRASLSRAFDALAADLPAADLAAAVDGIVRIRAVQEFAPSVAVGFAPALRGILREALADAAAGPGEREALDARVDRLALAAFDVYMQCREKLFQIRVREIRDLQAPATRLGS